MTSLDHRRLSDDAASRRDVLRRRIAAALVLGFASAGNAQNSNAQSVPEARYLEQTSRAMDQMMADMNVPPTGDVDADFVAMMAPHHRGAIDMAQAELTYGKNEMLRRIAQEIIVTQLQEIEAMGLALPARRAVNAAPPQADHHAP